MLALTFVRGVKSLRRFFPRPWAFELLEDRSMMSADVPILPPPAPLQAVTYAEYRNARIEELVANHRNILGTTRSYPGELMICFDSVTTGEIALTSSASSNSFSGTNVQESGVDEADMAKTDGKYLYLVRQDKIEIVDTNPANGLNVVSTIGIGGHVLGQYLLGDQLVVVSQQSWPIYRSTNSTSLAFWASSTESKFNVTLFDIDNPKAPEKTREFEFTTFNSPFETRLIGDDLLIVMGGSSSPNWLTPSVETSTEINDDGSITTYSYTYESEASFRARANAAFTETFSAKSRVFSSNGQRESDVHFADMATFYESSETPPPNTFWTTDSIRVLSLDLVGADQGAMQAVETNQAGWFDRIYTTESSLYVFSTNYSGDYQPQTELLKVAITDDGIELAASGRVVGHLLDQFAVDEENGYLRMATTVNAGINSANYLYVLGENEGVLETVGSVNLQAIGERIFSARLFGDKGYVVTFRNIDPLFSLDLSDPTNPRVTGELKIPGFSEYLHPVGENYLLAVGRPEQWTSNLQISLFDVSDDTNPIRIGEYTIDIDSEASNADGTSTWEQTRWTTGYTDVLHDHHAFSFFPESNSSGKLAIPLFVSHSGYVPDAESESWNWTTDSEHNLLVFDINTVTGISLVDEFQHESRVRRSLRIGDVLYSISDESVQSHEGVLNSVDISGAITTVKPAPKLDRPQPEFVPTNPVNRGVILVVSPGFVDVPVGGRVTVGTTLRNGDPAKESPAIDGVATPAVVIGSAAPFEGNAVSDAVAEGAPTPAGATQGTVVIASTGDVLAAAESRSHTAGGDSLATAEIDESLDKPVDGANQNQTPAVVVTPGWSDELAQAIGSIDTQMASNWARQVVRDCVDAAVSLWDRPTGEDLSLAAAVPDSPQEADSAGVKALLAAPTADAVDPMTNVAGVPAENRDALFEDAESAGEFLSPLVAGAVLAGLAGSLAALARGRHLQATGDDPYKRKDEDLG